MKPKTIGSIFILAGTTIGAGLLALPLSSAGLGFIPTLGLLLISYLLTAFSALVILETLAAIPGDKDLHFDSMCRVTLGKLGEYIFLIAYVTLMYAITSAYLSGGSTILFRLLEKLNVSLPVWSCSLLFTLLLACIVYKGAHTVDFFNRYFMSFKCIIFLLILFFFLSSVHTNYLVDTSQNLPYFFIAIPIIFLVFGYQLIIPSLFIYLDKDVKEIKKAIYIGSLISLAIFSLWLLVCLGSIPRFGAVSYFSFLSTDGDIAQFFDLVGKTQSYPAARDLLTIFSNLALITSFLGITLSLKDYFSDTKIIRKSKIRKQLSAVLTFLPPLLFVIFKPSLFQVALNYGAAMLVIVLLWLPCAMVIVVRRRVKGGQLISHYKTPGGNATVYLLIIAGVVIFVLGMLATFDSLPYFGLRN